MSGWDAGYATCRDHVELFDAAATGSRRAIEKARQVCVGCPVRGVCDVESLEYLEPDGVWAARTPRERMSAAVFLGIPRRVHPPAMESFDPVVGLVDRIDEALADGKPIGPIVFGTVADHHGGYKKWRQGFDARLSGGIPEPHSVKMKAS